MSLLFSAWLQAAVELNENVPETYIVKKGDTLWGISGMYLQKPWLWPQLWDANPQIDNPHLIYPGDELYLVWIDGQPKLRMRRGRDVKLEPEYAGHRPGPGDTDHSAGPDRPVAEVVPDCGRGRTRPGAPYIVSGSQQHLLSAPGDRVYGRGTFPDGERAYGIYRPGQPTTIRLPTSCWATRPRISVMPGC